MNSRFFSDSKVNTGRQQELDLLKALCVVGMIFVHVLLDLGKKVMPGVVDDYLTEFFGGATFMISMGIGMCYMRRQTSSSYLIRGFGLLTIGQFLNILRNCLPNLIGYWVTGRQFFISNSLLIIQADILTFAGLSLLLMSLFRKLRLSNGAILGVGVLMSLIALVMWRTLPAPYSWSVKPTHDSYLVSQLLAFFVITNAESYFPLFCYFVFVAFGYFIGDYYPRIRDKDALTNRIMAVCFPLAALYYVCRFTMKMSFLPELGSDLQYSMKPTPDAIATCLFTLGFLALLYKFVKLIGGKLPGFVTHFSTNINSYYCLSYLFILPVQTVLIALTGHLFPGKVIPLVYSFFVIFACYALIELNDRYWHIHFVTLKGAKMIVFTVTVWIATVAIIVYAYPRITEFANIWNEYLLP